MHGCEYPNVCYGPPDFTTPVPQGRYVIDMPASMVNPDGPWVVRRSLDGFGLSREASGGVGLILGVGAILAIVVLASLKGAEDR